MQATTENELLETIAQVCRTRDVLDDRDADLVDAGLLDSMAFVELLYALEDRFGVVVPPTEVDRTELDTVNKIVAFVDERL